MQRLYRGGGDGEKGCHGAGCKPGAERPYCQPRTPFTPLGLRLKPSQLSLWVEAISVN